TQAINAVPATPTGWTLVPNSSGTIAGGGTKLGYATFFRKGLSSDSSTNVGVTTTAAGVGEVLVYRGVDTSLSGACPGPTCVIRDAASGPTVGNPTSTVTLTTMSTSTASEEVIGTATALADVAWPAASTTGSFTRQSAAHANNSTTISLGLYDQNVTNAGSVSGPVGTGTNYTSTEYQWNAGTHIAPSAAERTLTEKDNGDNQTSNVVAIVDDSTVPTGGALSVNGTTATSGGATVYDTDGTFSIDSR